MSVLNTNQLKSALELAEPISGRRDTSVRGQQDCEGPRCETHGSGAFSQTIVEIVGVLKAVLASAVNNDGKRMFPREWNHEYIDLPVVDPKKQCRPTLTSKAGH